ncbi:MAG: hypothetical protein HZB61_09210 [Nitrospirae bacterium]|nr:hypothetical protein [Nitrospirota bacterium]
MNRLIDTSYFNRTRGHRFKRYLLNERRGVSCRSVKLSLCLVLMLLLLVLTTGINDHSAQAASMLKIVEGNKWRYFKGTTKPPHKWTSIDFEDSNWPHGMTGLGYGHSRNRTYLGDMRGNYSTVYSRRQFTINNIHAVSGINLSIVCDGAFIAYLNSIEIIRNDSVNKSASTPAPQAEQLDISGFTDELLPGKNVLSVECSNDDISSRDFVFIPVFEVFEHQGGQTQ